MTKTGSILATGAGLNPSATNIGSEHPPDISRPDAVVSVVTEFIVGTAERQRTFAQTFAASFAGAPWPRGLLSTNLFTSNDGTTVLLYSQWAGDGVDSDFAATPRESRVNQIDAAIPGIERRDAISYRLYRSTARAGGAQVPGCIVIVNVEFDGPDVERQRRWVDFVIEALEAETDPAPGGIAGHFHVSTDGTRVLNYAEWTDESAHVAAMERNGGSIEPDAKWQRVRSFPV